MLECQVCGTVLKTAISPVHLQGPKCCNREGRRLTVAEYHALFGGVLHRGKVYAEGAVAGADRGGGLGVGEEERATNRRAVRTRRTASLMSLVEKITPADIDAELDALETQIRQLMAGEGKAQGAALVDPRRCGEAGGLARGAAGGRPGRQLRAGDRCLYGRGHLAGDEPLSRDGHVPPRCAGGRRGKSATSGKPGCR